MAPSIPQSWLDTKKEKTSKMNCFEISSQPNLDLVLLQEKEKKIKHHL